MSTPSLYWFDYETFGTHPAWDRPCQFAGIRTDMELKEIGEPLMLYCRQSMDYLPHPGACKVTGLSPIQVNRQGLPEHQFIEKIIKEIGAPGTCSLGYNSIRFDDEFSRHTLFRNFMDPYEHEYRDGASRWDLLDVVRLTRALRPEGINWPFNEDGRPSNRLEHLSAANGIAHVDAHDALSDVRATIEMAKLIKRAQPKLFHYAFDNRGKQALAKLLNVQNSGISLLVSGTVPAIRSHIAPIMPLALHPTNRNSVIVLDLENDPSALIKADEEQLNQAFQRKQNDGDDQTQRLPALRSVQLNKCPIVVPYAVLHDNDAQRLNISKAHIERHARIAESELMSKEVQARIRRAITVQSWPDSHDDVDGSLYSGGFMSPADKARAELLRNADPVKMQDIGAHFEDKRFVELAWRYQARNYPESLTADQQHRWREQCHERLSDDSAPWLGFDAFRKELDSDGWQQSHTGLMKELRNYLSSVAAYITPDDESSSSQSLVDDLDIA